MYYSTKEGFEKCEKSLSKTELIQAFGCLLWASRTDKIIHRVSANAMSMLGIETILGKQLAEIIGYEMSTRLWSMNYGKRFEDTWGNFQIYGSAFESGLIIEIEPMMLNEKRKRKFSLYDSKTREEVIDKTIKRLAEDSNFERVMLYEFLPDGSGQVSAEFYTGNGDSYLGLRYPATDIPVVARELYVKNYYRYIYDVNARDIPLLSTDNEVNTPIDLSISSLRNVSPFHIEYLKNMGVESALSVSLVKDNRLIGMFSMHNSKPKYIPHDSRMKLVDIANEYLLRLLFIESEEKLFFLDSYKRDVATFLTATQDGFYQESEITKMLSIVGATGLAVHSGERWFGVGDITLSETLKAIEESITLGKAKGIFETDCISSLYVSMEPYKEQIAGILCVWYSDLITHKKVSFLFVKPEVIKEVTWGSKADIYKGDSNPINSFGEWKESMSFHSEPWSKNAFNAAQSILFLSITNRIK